MTRQTPPRTCCYAVLPALLFFPLHARADSAIPGPVIWFGGTQTVSIWQWIAVTMFMCVSVEWAVYRYFRSYRRPFVASALSNTVSLIVGIPLSLLGAFDPTWFVLPTIASILVEYWSIRAICRFVLADASAKVAASPVIWGNVASNLMLIGLIYIAYLKSQGTLSEFIFF